jgi:cobalt-zinc-cadmium efflux system outer membrane protein
MRRRSVFTVILWSDRSGRDAGPPTLITTMPRLVEVLFRKALPAAMICIAGCAHYTPQPLQPEKSLRALEARRLDADKEWGRAQLLVAALDLNPEVAEARAVLAQTTASVKTAGELQNPAVSLSSEYDLTRAAESPWLWGLATSFLTDTFVSRGLRVNLAEANVRGARSDFEEVLWGVRKDLRSALLALEIESRRVTLLETDVTSRDQLVRLADARVQAGASARSEGLQAQLELSRSRAALDDARTASADARARLAGALGVSSVALVGIVPKFEELDAPPTLEADRFERLRARALLSRADLAKTLADYDARELDLRQQMGSQYLQFSVGPGYTYDHGIRKITLGASIALPLFNQNQGPIAEAFAAREAAGRHAEVIQAAVFAEIDGARQTYDAASSALTRARSQRQTSEALAQASRRALELDANDQPTVLAAESAANADRLVELDALDRAQQALGLLEDALRAPLAGPERDLVPSNLSTRNPTDPR